MFMETESDEECMANMRSGDEESAGQRGGATKATADHQTLTRT